MNLKGGAMKNKSASIDEINSLLKRISYVAFANGVISRGLYAQANGINRAEIDDYILNIEKELGLEEKEAIKWQRSARQAVPVARTGRGKG
jgi:hypothetical protein